MSSVPACGTAQRQPVQEAYRPPATPFVAGQKNTNGKPFAEEDELLELLVLEDEDAVEELELLLIDDELLEAVLEVLDEDELEELVEVDDEEELVLEELLEEESSTG